MRLIISINFLFFISNYSIGQKLTVIPEKYLYKQGDTAIIKLLDNAFLYTAVASEKGVPVTFSSLLNGKKVSKEYGLDSVINSEMKIELTEEGIQTFITEFERRYKKNDVVLTQDLLKRVNNAQLFQEQLGSKSIKDIKVNYNLKALIHIGMFKGDEKYTAASNILLDIFPESNLFDTKETFLSKRFRLKVYYNGIPFTKAKIKVENTFLDGSVKVKYLTTNKEGIVNIPLKYPAPGFFTISCINADRTNEDGHLNIYYSSITTGFGKGNFFIKRRVSTTNR